MADLKFSSQTESRNVIGEWVFRIAVSAFYGISGFEKFSESPHWVRLFHEIGFGDWFPYTAGIVEIAGAALVLIPRTLSSELHISRSGWRTSAKAAAKTCRIFGP